MTSAFCPKAMTRPSAQIDGADVVAYEILAPAIHVDTGTPRLYANGALQTYLYGLAIATYDVENFYLFFCDSNWEMENDTFHDSVGDAIETAKSKFGILPDDWATTLMRCAPLDALLVSTPLRGREHLAVT